MRLNGYQLKNQMKSKTNQQIDQVYAQPQKKLGDFKFDQKVADVFPDMIARSVPGYELVIELIGQLSERYAQDGSNCFDLGCSLGAASLAMRHKIPHRDCRIISVDNSPAMVERCRKIIARDHAIVPVEVIEGDIQSIPIKNASIVVMNFTLQFIPPTQRTQMLQNIYQGLNPGGILILSEKIRLSAPQNDTLQTELHHWFKKSNGYTDLEISQKRSALENVMITDSLDQHRERLVDAGFNSVDVWFRCFNFCSMLAIKT